MPEARVELARGCPRRILSPLRLPFRHSGRGSNFVRTREGCKRPLQSVHSASRRQGPFMPVAQSRGFHPWHDIPTGPKPPAVVTAVIEIPTNERNKYELAKKLGVFRLARALPSAVHYPGAYGFLP